MTSLLIAHSALWILMIGMAILLLLLSRQVGALHLRVAPAGALMVNEVLELGQPAPPMTVTTLDNRQVLIGEGRSRSQLLLFVQVVCTRKQWHTAPSSDKGQPLV